MRETAERATGDVPHRVAARTGGGEPGLVQMLEDGGQRAELDEVELHVLPRRELAFAAPVTFEISPIARNWTGEVIPPGILTRSMNVPIFGLSW